MDLSIYKPYKKDFDFSYTLGAFPTMELIKKRPESVRCVVIHSKYDGSVDFSEVCRKNNIEVVYNDKIVNRIASKDNCFVIGVFDKFSCELNEKCNHVLLVNPSDMGNLGTIIRTLTGLGIYDLGIIAPCADIYNPKTIRASMGAVFTMRFHIYDNYESYKQRYRRDYFPFMLNGENDLDINNCPASKLFTLIFGNEASGLPEFFKDEGRSIFIPQTKDVDSLNLSISVGIGTFTFLSKSKV